MVHRCAVLVLAFLLAGPDSWSRDRHFSFWSDNPQPFLNAIRNSATQTLPPVSQGQRICGGIVTHHFLASSLMVRFFAGLASRPSPRTIILLAPNHYHHGLAEVSVSSLPWQTPFGLLPVDRQLVHSITSAIQLPEDPEAFTGEHSVGVLIPFVKHYFPASRVVPILIDLNAPTYRLRQLRSVLSAALQNPDTLLLLSMDFSHNSIASIANDRDTEAQAVLSSMDSSRTDTLHVDSRKGLWLLLESMNETGCTRVQFKEHTNSALLTRKPNQPDVTSYFTLYFLN